MKHLPIFLIFSLLASCAPYSVPVESVIYQKGHLYEFRVRKGGQVFVWINPAKSSHLKSAAFSQSDLSKLEVYLRSNQGKLISDIDVPEGHTKRIPLNRYKDAYGTMISGNYASMLLVNSVNPVNGMGVDGDFSIIIKDPSGVTKENGMRVLADKPL